MGVFDMYKDKPSHTQQQVMQRGMEAVAAYKAGDYAKAARMFEEYFEIKSTCNYPQLGANDYSMRTNMMLSLFHAKEYQRCIDTCNALIHMNPYVSDVYAICALSHHRIGNTGSASRLWEMAKRKGSQYTVGCDSIEDARM